MKIGIVTPFRPSDLSPFLDFNSRKVAEEITDLSATPVAPLVKFLLKNGHKIIVYSLSKLVSSPLELVGENLTIHILPKRRAMYCMLDFYRSERVFISNAIQNAPPDVISAQWTYDHALAALDSNIPVVVTCHDTPLRYAWISKSIYMTYHLFVAAKVIRSAKHLVCVSPYTEKHIKRFFKPKGQISVIPNGLSGDVFDRGKRRLLQPNQENHNFTICSIGSWGGLKNIKSLIKAFALLKDHQVPHRLVLFGRGLGPSEAAELWAKKHNLSTGITFIGQHPRDEIVNFLENEADLIVHPSKVETHGMVLIEAMACAVPVIGGARSGAVPWTLEEGKAGLLCDILNPRSIASSIKQVIDNPKETREMTEYAWESVHRRFQIEDAAQANEKLMIEIANVHSHR